MPDPGDWCETGTELAARLLAKSVVEPATGCRRWTGAHDSRGYGQISLNGCVRRVHVVAHELWVGPVPDGREIDHVHARGCRFLDCLEPSHLEAVTHAENTGRWADLITHCPQGHEYTPENTWLRHRPGRRPTRCCRQCKRDKAHDRWVARKAVRGAPGA